MTEEIKAILKEAKEKNVKYVRLQFIDILGTAKNTTIPVERLGEVLEDGLWFDGSSIEGFTRIAESDMIMMPDLSTFKVLPFQVGTHTFARLICDIQLPDGKPFEGDPRFILKRALGEAKKEGFNFFVGPELEYFYFKPAQNGELKPIPDPHDTAGYFDLAPIDLAAEVRADTIASMQALGVEMEMGHHEVAQGQHEIDFKYDSALEMADKVMTYKQVLKTVAQRHGLFASFMPKPIAGINGSGMHVHQSLWDLKTNTNVFFDADASYHLSTTARHFIGGQIKHIKEFIALLAPTVNSYKRLVPGYEAPVYIAWAQINRSALIRIPRYREGKESAARAELRCPDPSANPYLAFAAMLKAGLDGVKNKVEPPEPVEEDLYEFDDAKRTERGVDTLPASLSEAVNHFKKSSLMKQTLGDHAFNGFIRAKEAEWDSYRLSVHQWELDRYLAYL